MRKRSVAHLIVLLFSIAILSGCGPNPRIMNSAQPTPDVPINAGPKLSPFEADVQAMRNADFEFIFVVRRKDGETISPDDKKFINEVTPAQTNRRTLSDEDRAVILGSNFEFSNDVIEKLKDRFEFTDHSKPGRTEKESQAPANDSN